MFKVTFENEPEKNGSTTSWPPSLVGCLHTVQELLEVAAKRDTPTTITIEVRPPLGPLAGGWR
jgi:hypothetical protein